MIFKIERVIALPPAVVCPEWQSGRYLHEGESERASETISLERPENGKL